MTLTNCRIVASPQNDTSAVMVDNWGGKIYNVTIDHNYLEGGQYTLYCDWRFNKTAIDAKTFIVTNNTIKAGHYGPTAFYESEAGYPGVKLGAGNKLI
jgi:hypothetical protein